jgi:hypothetical protein
MKYAVLFYLPPEELARRAGPDAEAFWSGYRAYHLALVEAKAIMGGEALADPSTAKTVQLVRGRRQVQDGPYADTKEQLAGFMLLDAPDLDAALEWAARCPGASAGSVEVRPLMVFPGAGEQAEQSAPEATHVLLLYGDEAQEARMTPAQQDEMMGAYFAYSAALREAGAMAGGEPLDPTTTATTVRLRGGRRLVQDGPFADTKEQLGGYYVLSCKSDEEALAWAARCPCAETGVVEVRAVLRKGG